MKWDKTRFEIRIRRRRRIGAGEDSAGRGTGREEFLVIPRSSGDHLSCRYSSDENAGCAKVNVLGRFLHTVVILTKANTLLMWRPYQCLFSNCHGRLKTKFEPTNLRMMNLQTFEFVQLQIRNCNSILLFN